MDISQHTFRQDEITQLRQYRDLRRDGRLNIRFIALLMLAESLPREQTTSFIGRSVKLEDNNKNVKVVSSILQKHYQHTRALRGYAACLRHQALKTQW